MSRVEEQQQKAAAEAERLQKQQDRDAREAKRSDESRQRFGQMLQRGAQEKRASAAQASRQDEAGRTARENVERQEQSKASLRDARLARGGTLQHQRLLDQAKSFQGTLEHQRTQTEQTQTEQVRARDDGLAETRLHNEDRVADLETTREQETERELEVRQAEARDEERVNSAISGHGQRGSGGGGGNHPQDTKTPEVEELSDSKRPSGAGSSPQARAVQEVTEQILAALAREVFVGVNERGFAEMRIELQEGVLQGGTLRVEAQDGEIRLRFEGLSGHARNLVSSSEGELSRRLAAKGLRLAALAA